MKPISLDELLTRDPVIAAAANGTLIRRNKQNLDAVLREFGSDKWGALLRLANASPQFRVEHAVAWELPSSQDIFICDQGIILAVNGATAHHRRIERITTLLGDLGCESDTIVELGAGYGAILLSIMQHPNFLRHHAVARELTDEGRQAIGLFARRQSRQIDIDYCNLRDGSVAHPVPLAGATVFTSFAMHYAPMLSASVFERLASYRPSMVVHFEPVYELHQSKSDWDRLIRFYMEQNDYTLNLLGAAREAEADGHIRIVHIQPSILGSNPLLPAACVAWKPV